MPEQPELIASWERTWSDAGLGSFAVHVQTEDAATLRSRIGEQLCAAVADRSDLLRLDPCIDLDTFAALLQATGWAVKREDESSLRARPRLQSR